MATKIQLRNSVVKDKAPLPSELVIGEVCVGAHEDSPMLIFKDNADNIVKIKPGSGVTPGPDAPDSPSPGDLWFDTDTSLLYYFNGSSWVELANASDVGEGLWQEEGSDYIKPKADDVGLKIPGSVDGIESTIENGTIATKIKDGNTQQLYRGTVGLNDVFFVSYAGEIYADNIATVKGVTLQTDTDSDGLYVRTTGGSDNAITALADGSINAKGKITAAVFDLESLTSLKDAPSS